MLKLPVKPPIVNENIDLSEYAKKSDVDAIDASLGNKAEKKEVEKINSQLDTLTKKVDDEIKEIQSTTDTFKENINTSFNEFSNEQQNNFEALREEVLSDIEASYVGYDNEQHHNLESRLYSDFDKINQRFNNNSYLEYEGTSIKADNTYYGLTKDTVVKGRTLQNIVKSYKPSEFQMLHAEMVSEGVFKLPEGESVNHTNVQARARNHIYKPNTMYTVFVDILENTTSKKLGISNINSMISTGYERDFQNLIGVSCVKFTTSANGLSPQGTPPALGIYFGIWNANDTSGEFSKYIKFKYWILEGDHTQTPLEELPFIEGIESTGDKSKNLINPNTIIDNTTLNNNGVEVSDTRYIVTDFIKVNPNTSYFTTGLTVGHEYDDNKNFIRVIRNTSTDGTFLTSSTAGYVRLRNYTLLENKEAKQEMISKCMLQVGTQATPYEPYYDGYKISGKSCGKNLFDIRKLYGALYEDKTPLEITEEGKVIVYAKNNDTYTHTGATGSPICKEIERKHLYLVHENTTYTLSMKCEGENYAANYIQFYDENYNSLGLKGYGTDTEFKTTFKTPMRTKFLGIRIGIKDATVGSSLCYSDFQLEENTVATSYEPYQESTYSYILDRPLMQLPNGVADSINLETGILTRRIRKFIADGTENWVKRTNGTEDTVIFLSLDENKTVFDAKPNPTCLCDKFVQDMTAGAIKYPYGMRITEYSQKQRLHFCMPINSNITEVEQFKSWLMNNPVTVLYELAEPTTEQLTPTQLKSFEGTTHIMSNNTLQARTSVKIHSYVQAVVTNLINENEALRSNVDILNVENEGLKETNEVQDELIDINMMATDEVYTMIEPLLASQPMSMERGMSKLVDMYVAMVQRGLKTIDQVPIRYRAEVQAILEALEK